MLRSPRPGRRGLRRAHGLRQEPDHARRSRGSCATRGKRVAVVRHPMPYGDLARAARAALRDATRISTPPTARSRSGRSTSRTSRAGSVVYAGVDYAAILARGRAGSRRRSSGTAATTTCRSIRPDLHIVVVDPHRPGHELRYHPGETEPAHGRRRASSTRSTPRRAEGVEAVDAIDPHASTPTPRSSRAASPFTVDRPDAIARQARARRSRTGPRSRTAR